MVITAIFPIVFFKLDNLREIIKQNIIDRISRVTFPINVICILFSVVML